MIINNIGKESTQMTVDLAVKAAKERGIEHIIVASGTGFTAEHLKDYGLKVTVVRTVNGGMKGDGLRVPKVAVARNLRTAAAPHPPLAGFHEGKTVPLPSVAGRDEDSFEVAYRPCARARDVVVSQAAVGKPHDGAVDLRHEHRGIMIAQNHRHLLQALLVAVSMPDGARQRDNGIRVFDASLSSAHSPSPSHPDRVRGGS